MQRMSFLSGRQTALQGTKRGAVGDMTGRMEVMVCASGGLKGGGRVQFAQYFWTERAGRAGRIRPALLPPRRHKLGANQRMQCLKSTLTIEDNQRQRLANLVCGQKAGQELG
jgi:hypothetical protein